MTDKRFYIEDNCVGYYTEIIDTEKEVDLTLNNPQKNLTIEELCGLLNELAEENEQLKMEIEILQEKIDVDRIIRRGFL